jgi:uncharacterized protein YggE
MMRLYAAVLIALLLPVAPAFGQAPPRTITVNGQAEVRVDPDEVLLVLGIETVDADVTRARADNDVRVKAVVAAASRLGIRPEHMKTEFLDIQPRYRNESDRRTFYGYFARRSLSITLRDVSKFESLLSDVLLAGANYVHGVEFKTTELRRHRDEARRRAVQAAREKAVDMASALNAGIAAPTNIHEVQNWWSYPYHHWGARWDQMGAQNVLQDYRAAGAQDGSLVPGQISVSATVSVTFELAPGR